MNSAPENPADLPIGEAAWDTQQIERMGPLRGAFDVCLGATFKDADCRSAFAQREYIEPLRSYLLREVTLDASLMLLLKGRSRISETRYLVTDEEYAATLVKPLHPQPLDPSTYYVIGANRAWYNYYHWLIQAVPAIDWAIRLRGRSKVTLVLPPLQSWQEELLVLLGYQDIPRLTLALSAHYLLPEVQFSEFLGDRMPGVVSHAAAATFRRLAATAPWLLGAADEIYIARTDAQNRVAVNEAELIALLERQGVRIIVPGTLPVAEQIAAFRAARLVIGPHGAGMSNIAFCQPGNFVYELLADNYLNPCFNRLAQSVGVNYFADLFESQGEGTIHQQTWRIDLNIVAARLDTIRGRIATARRVESAIDFLKRTQTVQPSEAAAPVRPSGSDVEASAQRHQRGLFARSVRVFARLFSGRSG